MRHIIVLALFSFVVVCAAVAPQKSKQEATFEALNAALADKHDARKVKAAKAFLERHKMAGGKVDKAEFLKFAKREAKVPQDIKDDGPRRSALRKEVLEKMESRMAQMKEKRDMREKFVKPEHTADKVMPGKLRTIEDAKQYVMSKAIRTPAGFQLPEKFQKKMNL